MADLLGIDWTPINESLEGFSQDGVESFVNIEIKHTVCKSKSNAILESLNRVLCFSSLYEGRSHRERLAKALYIGVISKYFDGKGDVEDALASE